MFRGMTEHEEGDHGFELSLELSIGRSTHDHGKTKKMEGETKGPFDENVGNLDDVSFAHEKPEGVINGDGFLEEKQFLEAQQFRARARDREDREREEVFSPEDPFRQKDRNGGTNGSVGKVLHMRQTEGLLLPQEGCRDGFVSSGEIPSSGPVVEKDGTNLFRPVACGNDSSSCDDYAHQGTPHKGESKSNTGSRSSSLSMHQKPCSSTTGPMQPEPDQGLSSPSKKPKRAESDINCNQAKSTCSTSEKRSSHLLKGTSDLINKPPMPCVSTTGNGPNGKTITGFLYKYTKDEVSITCVCHGSSFSPAGFVEHAGGIDITHPLKHITVVPSASVSVDKC